MNASEREGLRRALEEASALSKDDAQFQRAAERAAAAGGWASEHWQLLLREAAALRESLPAVEPAARLEHRLLEVGKKAAARTTTPCSRRASHWPLVGAAVAAVVLVAMALALQLLIDEPGDAAETVARLAIDNHVDHLDDDHLSVATADAETLERAMADHVPFRVVVPELAARLRLRGGRPCKLGSHAVAFMAWSGRAGDYSLYQFEPGDFGLPAAASRRLVGARPPAAEHCTGAVIWIEDNRGYALVGQGAAELEQVLRQPSPGENGE